MVKQGFLTGSIKGLKIILQSEPKKLFVQCLFTIAHGLSWTLQVVFTQRFFDAVQKSVEKEVSLGACFGAMTAMILAYMFAQVMNGADNCHAQILSLAMARHVNQKIFTELDSDSCLEFEDVKQLDAINKAVNGGANLIWVCSTLLDILFFYTTYFLSMSVYFFTLKPILCLSVFAVFIPSLISHMVQIRTFKDLENASAPVRRARDYFENCIFDIRETRLWGATSYFKTLYENNQKKLNKFVWHAQLKKNAVSLGLNVITVAGYGVILLMIFVMVLRREISIGAFAAVLASVGRLFSFMSEVISERIGWATENVATLEAFLDFIHRKKMPEAIEAKPANENISFQHVNFRYPYTEKNALTNISLTIKPGETIAIVGENGSGKTTLCRLLLGLYSATDGNITIGEHSLSNYNHRHDSAIFQNYCRYKMTIKDNICISQMNVPADDDTLKALCTEVGVDTDGEKLEQELYTMLGREFDGAELSGGQWQRLAIARGLYRKGNLIVLDEPTSAIDPLEESQLYHEFAKICCDRTAVIVTHRLGSVKIADRIIVMKEGIIVEDGTQDELLSENGEFRRMYESQRQWYLGG